MLTDGTLFVMLQWTHISTILSEHKKIIISVMCFLVCYTAKYCVCDLYCSDRKAEHDYDCGGHSCQWEAQKRSLNHCFWKSQEPRAWLQLLWKCPLSKKKKGKTAVQRERKLDLTWAKAQGYWSQSVLEKATVYLNGAERTLGVFQFAIL